MSTSRAVASSGSPCSATDPFVAEFRPQDGLKAVIAGVGVVHERLAAVLEAEGTARPMIVCGSNVAKSAVLDAVIAVGGSSAIDCAKGVARLVASGVETTAGLEPIALGHLGSAGSPDAG